MSFTETQRAFVACRDPYPAYVGGFGSGKTAAAIARTMYLKAAFREQDVAYYLPSFPLVEDIAMRRFPAYCESKGWDFKMRGGTSPHIEFPNGGRVLFRSMSNPNAIVGYEVAHSICDELDTLRPELARDVWNKIIARNRQKLPNGFPNTVAAATTPEGFGFVYERWVKSPAPGYRLFRARTMDNAANLPPGYIDNLRASYPSNLLAAYLDGEFVNLSAGSVYPEFDRALNSSDAKIEPRETLHVGMDFNVTKMAAVVHVLRGNDPHAVSELTGIFDTPEMARVIRDRYPDHPIIVYPDASGRSRKSQNASESDIAILRQAKFTVLANPSNPAVKDRVLAVNRMIHAGGARRYRVDQQACPHLVEALEKQPYDKNGEPDKAGGLDHVCFSADTLVQTRAGVYRFDEIPERGEVLGPHGDFVPYHSAGKTGNKRTVRITIAGGYVIECTHDHLFLTETGEWVQASELMGHACVLSVPQGRISADAATTFAEITSWIREAMASAVCIARYGWRMAGRFLMGSTFITSTTTAATTRLKTSHVSAAQNTPGIMGLNSLSGLQRWARSISTSRSSGTHRKLALSGTESSTSGLKASFERENPQGAVAAERISWPLSVSSPAHLGTAPKPARHTSAGRAALTMLIERAASAARHSGRTSTAPARAVTSVSPAGEQSVYCLTVPEYGAFKLSDESPVVSNCDAAGYFIAYRYPVAKREAKVSPLSL